jgi:hypothetical protein
LDPSLIFRPEVVWVFIPVSAIVLGIGTGLVKIILESAEKRLEMRLRLQQGADSGVKDQIDALRAEIAGLRDTSTQFDMSLQHSLEGLSERMRAVEQGRRPYATASAPEQEQVRQVGRG